jgi:hypothetical protein
MEQDANLREDKISHPLLIETHIPANSYVVLALRFFHHLHLVHVEFHKETMSIEPRAFTNLKKKVTNTTSRYSLRSGMNPKK